MGGSAIITVGLAIITGVIIADILTHPVGTQAAANGVATLWNPSLGALLGNSPK